MFMFDCCSSLTFPPLKCVSWTILTCKRPKLVTIKVFSNSSVEGGDVDALPKNMRFKLGELGWVNHKYKSKYSAMT